MGTLSGKMAWVTGAGTGIGLAGAQALAASGALVVMSGRRGDVLEREAGAIRKGRRQSRSRGARCQRRGGSQADGGTHPRAPRQVSTSWSTAPGLNNPQRFWRDQTVESWDQVIRINLDGTFYCTQAVIPAMRNRKDGLVINISSWAGKYTSAMVGAAYNGSKAAVVSLTETINMEECINGIRACAICPAEVATPILDRRPVPPSAEERAKMLQPVDLGKTIRWVAEQPRNGVRQRAHHQPDVEPPVRRRREMTQR